MSRNTESSRGSLGSFTMNVLNGISIAVVVALVPQALLGELLKALVPHWPALKTLLMLVTLSSSMLPILIGVLVAMQFKLTPIQTASVGIAAVLGSGVAAVDPNGGFHLQGTGLVINTGLTAALAVGLVLFIGPKLGNYTILLLSTIVIVVAGGIGWVVTYPAVDAFSVWLGDVINGATGLQPIVMGAILAVAFALGIVSPISTVGIATAIYMSGVASGTANLGVVAAGFGLAIAGWKANGVATSLLPILGSPKVHMANIWGRPINFLPLALSAAVLGAAGGALGISGTPISAGFGISGLVGPLAALNAEGWGWSVSNVLIILAIFVVAPIILAFASFWACEKAGLVAPENYKLNFE
ncbi:PTS sugar transporter subunit IIC [Corynebacterium pseudotuberculosis]|uniref:Regulator n=1 Tax=Corynebacterium pseudotuberculosis (strain C231) TaxID=681645 RepID=D9QBL2_CORP2|nr:PTS sugar transporter subunit IIC [Corynebacterium pseudotuberculosis]ADK29271.1 regulator [Corynebacterium pseudotuberculosis FRC41]ADL10938.1 regulator [Corynebacterium pseudotuberculosis C231]ADL21339.1 PTS sugar transporter subunit IIC [Corynebacterium pseudotuberculosis 1002]ADO26738.1 regulator [Corynebacterium pseudotuberculosis I19]AEK92801.1 Regulatory protein [Corynebacterium pseudotuberculosis PAT10]